MSALVRLFLRMRALILILLACMLVAGTFGALQLDVEAYPDPSPPLVEIITQNPSWSAEEMEQQVTAPVETSLFGMPHLDGVRSISIFGLSDVKLYFTFTSDYFRDRQEVLDRLQLIQLPNGLQPQLSPWSPIGEIYRYELVGPYTLNDLTATQDWLVRRELKQVPGHHRHHHLRRPGQAVPDRGRSTEAAGTTVSPCRRYSPPCRTPTRTPAVTMSRLANKASTFALSASSTQSAISSRSSSRRTRAYPSSWAM